jgi:DNA adenine methylase
MTATAVSATSDAADGLRPSSPAGFLRWQGSKRSISDQIAKLVPEDTARYVEPFLGSGAVFFRLQPQEALLIDVLPELIATYEAVKSTPSELAQAVGQLAGDDYYAVRAQTTRTTIETAARFLYLNSHCFNGLYRTNRRGQFNVPRGTRVPGPPSLQVLTEASKALRSAQMHCGDALTLLSSARPGDFWYLDPPFPTNRPSYGEYGYHGFGREQMEYLLTEGVRTLDRLGARFAVSVPSEYGSAESAVDLKAIRRSEALTIRYQVAGNRPSRAHTTEYLVTNIAGTTP